MLLMVAELVDAGVLARVDLARGCCASIVELKTKPLRHRTNNDRFMGSAPLTLGFLQESTLDVSKKVRGFAYKFVMSGQKFLPIPPDLFK